MPSVKIGSFADIFCCAFVAENNWCALVLRFEKKSASSNCSDTVGPDQWRIQKFWKRGGAEAVKTKTVCYRGANAGYSGKRRGLGKRKPHGIHGRSPGRDRSPPDTKSFKKEAQNLVKSDEEF